MRALTAPLSIAGSLVGGSIPGLSLLQGEGSGDGPLDLSAISFAPGSSELSPLGVRTLEALAAFLRERPEARLQIIPSVDPESDFEAQARQRLEARLADLGAPSRSQAIRQLYGQTSGCRWRWKPPRRRETPAVRPPAKPPVPHPRRAGRPREGSSCPGTKNARLSGAVFLSLGPVPVDRVSGVSTPVNAPPSPDLPSRLQRRGPKRPARMWTPPRRPMHPARRLICARWSVACSPSFRRTMTHWPFWLGSARKASGNFSSKRPGSLRTDCSPHPPSDPSGAPGRGVIFEFATGLE